MISNIIKIYFSSEWGTINLDKDSIQKWVDSQRIFVSSLNTDELLNSGFVLNSPRRGLAPFLRKGWKTIDQLKDLGSIVNGDIALSLYTKNGVRLLNHDPYKWDLILLRDKFIDFCDKRKLDDFEYHEGRISTQFEEGYNLGTFIKNGPIDIKLDPLYILTHEIKISGSEFLPDYINVNGWKINKIENILNEKLDKILYNLDYKNDWSFFTNEMLKFHKIIQNIKR